MSNIDSKNSAEKLRSLQASYLIHLSEKVKALETCRHSVLDGPLTGQTLETLKGLAHQLAGGGSIYGYPAITDAAQMLETFLDEWRGGKASELTHKLDRLYETCKAAINHGPKHDVPEGAGHTNQDTTSKLPLVAAIDDDPMLRLVYKTLLEDKARLVTGTNANEALEIMQRDKPDLVLLDDIMPGGPTGMSFLESLKDNPALSRIPVIMVTASNRKEEVLRGLAGGAIDYIIKPFMPDDLLRAVEAGLRRKEHKIILGLKNHHLSDALIDRMAPLNCRTIDLDREGKSLPEAVNYEPCIIILDHMPTSIVDLAELTSHYPHSYIITIGEDCDSLRAYLEPPRLVTFPPTPRAEEIVYAAGHMIAEIKKGQKNKK